MVFVTGDCHADFSRFSTKNFPEQKQMHRSDTVIICGDFGGVWDYSSQGVARLDALSKRPYTTCFVDGNHENFDRLYDGEFPTVEFHGGLAHKIRNGVYHLIRGHVFEFEGKKFFCMGGASSHDIQDGILDPEDFRDIRDFYLEYHRMCDQNMMFRIKHVSWWEEELPSEREMEFADRELAKHGYKVDYVITHCLPTSIASAFSGGLYKPDKLTDFFDHLLRDRDLQFQEWHCGHYHRVSRVLGLPFFIHYEDITRLL